MSEIDGIIKLSLGVELDGNSLSNSEEALAKKFGKSDELSKIRNSIEKTKKSIVELQDKMSDIKAGFLPTNKISAEFKALEKDIETTTKQLEQFKASPTVSIDVPKNATDNAKELLSRLHTIEYYTGKVGKYDIGYGTTTNLDVKDIIATRDAIQHELDTMHNLDKVTVDSMQNSVKWFDTLIPKIDETEAKLKDLVAQRDRMISTGSQFELRDVTPADVTKTESQLSAQTQQLAALQSQETKLLDILKAREEHEQLIANLKKNAIVLDKKEVERQERIKEIQDSIASKKQDVETYKSAQANLKEAGVGKGYAQWEAIENAIKQTENEVVALEQELIQLDGAFDEAGNKGSQNAEKMVSAYGVVGNAISRLIPGIGSQLGTIVNSFGKLIENSNGVGQAARGMASQTTQATGQMASSTAQNANLIIMIIGAVLGIMTSAFKKVKSLGEKALGYFNNALRKLGGLLTSIGQSFVGLSAKVGKFSANVIKSFGKLTSSIFGLGKSHNKGFKQMLNMVLKYGLGIRSLYMLFKKVKSMIIEGFQDMAKYCDRFNKAMTNLKSSWGQLKGQLSAMVEPIITALEPILTRIIEKLTAAALAITKFFGAFMGFGKVLKATKVVKDYANAVGSANKQLAGFDELNNLTSNDGGGGDLGDNGWEWVNAEMPDWWEKIKESWNTNQDFTWLGKLIGDKIIEALNKIPWSKIKNVARKLGKSFATFLNGLISQNLFGTIGRTIAQGLNTILEFLYAFVDNFDFENLGKSIATGIYNLFNMIDYNKLKGIGLKVGEGIADVISSVFGNSTAMLSIGNAMAQWVNTFINMLSGFVSHMEWTKVANSIADGFIFMVNSIDFDLLTDSLISGFSGALNSIVTFINRLFDNNGIDWDNLASNLSKGITGIFTSLKDAFASINFEDIKKSISEFMGSFNVSDIASSISEFINTMSSSGMIDTLFSSIKDFFGKASNDINGENSGIFGFLNKLFTDIDFDLLIENLSDGINQVITDLGDNINTIIDSLVDNIDAEKLGESINKTLTTLLQQLYKISQNGKLEEWISTFFDSVDIDSLIDSFFFVVESFIKKVPVDKIASALLHVFAGESNLGKTVIETFLNSLFDSDGAFDFEMNVDFSKAFSQAASNITRALLGAAPTDLLADLIDTLFGDGDSVAQAIVDKLGNNWFSRAVAGLFGFDVQPPDDVDVSAFEQVGQNVMQGLLNGIKNFLFPSSVFSDIFTRIKDGICNLFKIHSPSVVAEEWGGYIIEGLINGMVNMAHTIGEKIAFIKDEVVNKFIEIRDNVALKLDEWKTTIEEKMAFIKDSFISKWSEIKDNVSSKFEELKGDVLAKFDEWKTDLSTKLTEVKGDFLLKWTEIKANTVNKFNEIKNSITTKMSEWKTSLSTTLANIKSTFVTTFTYVKSQLSSIFNGIWSTIKGVINKIIGGIETMANGVINGINSVINSLNSINISIPATPWGPAVNLGGFNFGTLSNISIPRLAQGGVIPPNNEFLAVLGDQKKGTNIETPLSTMLDAFNMALDQHSDNDVLVPLMQQQIQLLQIIAEKEFGITDRQIFKSVRNSAKEFYNSTGREAFNY